MVHVRLNITELALRRVDEVYRSRHRTPGILNSCMEYVNTARWGHYCTSRSCAATTLTELFFRGEDCPLARVTHRMDQV